MAEVYPLGESQHTKTVQRLARQVDKSIKGSTGVIEGSKENSQGNLEEELGAMYLRTRTRDIKYHGTTRFSRRIVGRRNQGFSRSRIQARIDPPGIPYRVFRSM